MIEKKRTWKDCRDQKILTIFNEIKDEAQKLYPQYFKDTIYKFYIDSSTRHLGRCEYKLKDHTQWFYGSEPQCEEVVILLSKYVTDEKAIRSVLTHEWGHAVSPREHHSALWQTRTNRIGSKFGIKDASRFAEEDYCKNFSENIKQSGVYIAKNQYTVKCTCCGAVVHRKKMCSLIKDPWMWRCGKCHGTFERIK